MRFVKQALLKSKFIVDKSVFVDINGVVSFEGSKSGLTLGSGTTEDRSSAPVNGTLRYNTTLNELEVYVDNAWEQIRTSRPGKIIVQNLGTGDASITDFGPLNPTPLEAGNILVLVENVVQIPDVNYTLVQGSGNKSVRFDSPVPFGKDVTVIHGYDGSILS